MDIRTFREAFDGLMAQSSHIAITAHYSPDDDSIGSVLSTHTILTDLYPGKDIRIIYTGEKVERYSIFSSFEKIEWVSDVADHLSGIDLLIVLDVNRISRISRTPELITVPKTVCIDHHASAPDAFTLTLVDTRFSSNCELIYNVFSDYPLTKDVAEHFLLGILGDTGNFAYVSPQQGEVFLVAKRLVETVGISIDAFRSRYGGIPKRIIPLLQELVKNTQYGHLEDWPDFQFSYIDRDTGAGYSDEDMSAASHIYMGQYLPRVQGYTWGFVLTPRADGSCRMSARSLPGSVNVRQLHESMGIGGGHDRAAGGYFAQGDPKDCIDVVLAYMAEHKPNLQ